MVICIFIIWMAAYWQCLSRLDSTTVTYTCWDVYIYILQQDVENLSEAKEDESQYWEPAATVNELYRQMASKKYREIDPQQIE